MAGGLLLVASLCSAGCDRKTAEAVEQPVPKVTVTAVDSARDDRDFDEYTGQTEASESRRDHEHEFSVTSRPSISRMAISCKRGRRCSPSNRIEYEAIHKQSLSKIASLGIGKLGVGQSATRPQCKVG